MNYIIDLVLIGFIIIMIMSGSKKGFVKTFLQLVSKIAAFIVSAVLSKIYAPKMYEAFFQSGVIRNIDERMTAGNVIDIAQKTTAAFNGIPSDLRGIADALGFTTETISNALKGVEFGNSGVAKTLEANVVSPVVITICRVILFALFSFVLSVVFKFIIGIISGFFELPVLKSANKMLGGIFGFVNAMLILWIVSYLLVVGSSFVGDDSIADMITSSNMIKLFINNNMLS